MVRVAVSEFRIDRVPSFECKWGLGSRVFEFPDHIGILESQAGLSDNPQHRNACSSARSIWGAYRDSADLQLRASAILGS